MNHSSESDWKPDPEMLAAFFDGELEGAMMPPLCVAHRGVDRNQSASRRALG